MFNMSSAMGAKFADSIREMTEQVAGLGPNPLRQPAQTHADGDQPSTGGHHLDESVEVV